MSGVTIGTVVVKICCGGDPLEKMNEELEEDDVPLCDFHGKIS